MITIIGPLLAAKVIIIGPPAGIQFPFHRDGGIMGYRSMTVELLWQIHSLKKPGDSLRGIQEKTGIDRVAVELAGGVFALTIGHSIDQAI